MPLSQIPGGVVLQRPSDRTCAFFFSSTHPDQLLVRWFKSHVHHMHTTISFLKKMGRLVETNDVLSSGLKVVSIREVGDDWALIERVCDATMLADLREKESHKTPILSELRKLDEDAHVRALAEMIRRNVGFIQWSPQLGKIVLSVPHGQ
jgi:hypothetical protein